ncbi:AAA family ATPase [Aestuariicoccus sp. MJ-SS9]|uniref:AAA family ATPase n=1 Tax=Aestuariicoccus sp. MJ-SS9 TaxID=3079855 RepID=UPI002915060A|nr:AAA family ATPase [Aestuariicoccus sp. MJ-SS9]MDU8913263.1 AAA family ATPase [Aestuariicoccus sp. MJ-SS9]
MNRFEHQAPPKTIEETGLNPGFLIGLTCKILYEGGTMTPADISGVIRLPKLVCRQLITEMTALNLVESQGLESADIKSDIRYSLTDAGRKWALEAMLVSQYIGPAPVSLAQFQRQIERQSISHEEVHRNDLEKTLSHLVIPKGMMSQLGPAANSGRSVLLYGEPGNGKTSIAEALGRSFHDTVFFPYAVVVGAQIIRFFDETLHEVADLPEDAEPLDGRWVPCKRPVVIAGGELTLDMLDLSFEPTARFYEAPMHLKALGGVFVLDDFGRQSSTPQEFLNRWIVPLEKGFDIMSLHTGKKFTVPFDQLVVFSSNMLPEELGDAASLRRIYFKIFVPSPTPDDYMQIFEDACQLYGLVWRRDVVSSFFKREYEDQNVVTSGAHPGFLLQHIKAACRYLDRPVELSEELLQIAWKNVSKSKRRGSPDKSWAQRTFGA